MEQLIEIGLIILTIIGGLITQNRRLSARNDEQDRLLREDMRNKLAERDARIKTLETENVELNRRVDELITLKGHYANLNDAYKLLKSDHEDLKAKFEATASDKAREQREREALQERYDNLKAENGRLFDANKVLVIERGAMERAFSWIGIKLQDVDTPAPIPDPDPPDPLGPQAPISAKPITDETDANDAETKEAA